ncbi:hypothetical protein SAMN06265379_101226 [Saccharicrinis carchari]|uniref:Uncharacterized protein n=1 Tax=Saccharicrinis carchari TaxID=1168039 RepID=A0A521AL75_SACCC|nr:Gfo/Idh/MocA family oxidoreductase [Saccharicrinis carchari]SMO35533.1 hypothetical protein SAMN06265379_101226 [Saccharicrinis carchari]
MEKQIKIGVLGCAGIAQKAVIPSLKTLQEFTLSGVASRSTSKADDFASQFATKAYYSYDELLSPTLVDAIYIPLPNALHYQWVKTALQRGIHVLVEKSLACTLKEVVELNDLAKEQKLALVENFQFRFHKQLQAIKQLLADDTIGELRCVRSSFGFPPFKEQDNIRYQAALGGGALLDAGAYPIKIAQEILGTNLKVSAAKLSFDDNKKVDIWGGGFIAQKKGDLFAEIAFGFDHFYQCNLELWGSKGKIYTNRIFTAPPGYEAEIILETNEGKETIKVKADNHFANMLLYFHKLILNPELPEREYQQNINQAQLIEEFVRLAGN